MQKQMLVSFLALVAMVPITVPLMAQLSPGVYTIQQQSNGRFVDAHETAAKNFALVTRTAQNNDTQRWVIRPRN